MKLAHLALNNNHSITNSGKYLFVVNKYSHIENTYMAASFILKWGCLVHTKLVLPRHFIVIKCVHLALLQDKNKCLENTNLVNIKSYHFP